MPYKEPAKEATKASRLSGPSPAPRGETQQVTPRVAGLHSHSAREWGRVPRAGAEDGRGEQVSIDGGGQVTPGSDLPVAHREGRHSGW